MHSKILWCSEKTQTTNNAKLSVFKISVTQHFHLAILFYFHALLYKMSIQEAWAN